MASLQGGIVEEGDAGVDQWGVVLLLSTAGCVLLVATVWMAAKARASRARWDCVAAGAFRLAAARGLVSQLEVLSCLPHFDVEARGPDAGGAFTALLAAAAMGRPGAATWLLHHGANVAATKQDGWRDTALHYAAGCGSLETVQVLLAWDADASATNALGALCGDDAGPAPMLG